MVRTQGPVRAAMQVSVDGLSRRHPLPWVTGGAVATYRKATAEVHHDLVKEELTFKGAVQLLNKTDHELDYQNDSSFQGPGPRAQGPGARGQVPGNWSDGVGYYR